MHKLPTLFSDWRINCVLLLLNFGENIWFFYLTSMGGFKKVLWISPNIYLLQQTTTFFWKKIKKTNVIGDMSRIFCIFGKLQVWNILFQQSYYEYNFLWYMNSLYENLNRMITFFACLNIKQAYAIAYC